MTFGGGGINIPIGVIVWPVKYLNIAPLFGNISKGFD